MNDQSALPIAFKRTDEAMDEMQRPQRPAAPAPSPVATILSYSDFHNLLRMLWNVDFDEFSAAIPRNASAKWAKFQENPHQFFVRADDTTAFALWGVISGRHSTGAT
jgi:hypothetical protein